MKKQHDQPGTPLDVRATRRTLLKTALALFGSGALASSVSPTRVPTLFAQGREGGVPAAARTQLLLLGTQGGPNINLQRGEAASALLVGDVPYLIDCGYGTLRALAQAGLRINDITTVFVTHLHDDHTSDIAALMSHKWTGSTATAGPAATTVYGPYGTAALVQGALAFFKANTEIRSTDEGRTVRPDTRFRGKDLTAGKVTEVFRDARVTVRAVENTHFPTRAKARMPYRSLAYRFTTADRSVVFSGDTAYSPAVIELARDADVLVCEAMDTEMHAQIRKEAEAAPGGLTAESVAHHIIETHVTTEEAGKMAAEARVKTLVLNHLLPGSNPQRGGPIADERYIEGVRRYFTGQVIVGADQMRI
jgi:ribonuclease BN (tRNA processing enzyme)